MTQKKFLLSANQIQRLVENMGACFATDKITVDGKSVRLMYREVPDNHLDSGWRFMSGEESEEYMNDPHNMGVYDVNTIANLDSSIIPYLDSPIGTALAKSLGEDHFAQVEDWLSTSIQ